MFLVKHVRHRSFFELEVNEERETSAFFPVARVSRSTPAVCFVRLKSAKNRRSTG